MPVFMILFPYVTGMERRICTGSWFRRQVAGGWCQFKTDRGASSEASVDDDDDDIKQQAAATHGEQEPDGTAVDAVEWQVDALKSVKSVGTLAEVWAPTCWPGGDRCTSPWPRVPGRAVLAVQCLTWVVWCWRAFTNCRKFVRCYFLVVYLWRTGCTSSIQCLQHDVHAVLLLFSALVAVRNTSCKPCPSSLLHVVLIIIIQYFVN